MHYIIEHFQLTPSGIQAFSERFEQQYLPLMSAEGARLVGLWEAVAVSLYWPRAMALWEIDDPKAYQGLVRQLYTDRIQDLRAWQAGLEGICSAGEGRFLGAAQGAPTLQDLIDREVDLSVIVYERITAQPDRQYDYVSAIEQSWLPTAKHLGRVWIGTYHTIWKNREAYSLWALEDPALPLPSGGVEEEALFRSEPVQEWMRLAPQLREAFDDGIMCALPPTRRVPS